MATMFEPSLSTSVMRAPYATANAPSMAESLPNINFGFDDLRERIARFTDRFDDFIAKSRKRVLEDHNQFKINLAELEEDQRMKKQDLEILAQTSTQYKASLSAQAAEAADHEAEIALITQQRDEHAQHRDNVRAEIETIRAQIKQRKEVQRGHSLAMQAQSRMNTPELDFWETYLGLQIDGAGMEDHIKFVFTCLDEQDWNKEAWIELNMMQVEYAIAHIKPKLEEGEQDALIEGFNQSRQLGPFLKGIRESFMRAMK